MGYIGYICAMDICNMLYIGYIYGPTLHGNHKQQNQHHLPAQKPNISQPTSCLLCNHKVFRRTDGVHCLSSCYHSWKFLVVEHGFMTIFMGLSDPTFHHDQVWLILYLSWNIPFKIPPCLTVKNPTFDIFWPWHMSKPPTKNSRLRHGNTRLQGSLKDFLQIRMKHTKKNNNILQILLVNKSWIHIHIYIYIYMVYIYIYICMIYIYVWYIHIISTLYIYIYTVTTFKYTDF